MEYTTLIPAVLVNQVELSDLVEHLAQVVKVKVSIEPCFIIKTDDVNFTTLMEDIAAQLNGGKGKTSKAENKKVKAKVKSGTIGKKSLVEEWSGKVISKQALKKLLADHVVDNNSVYTDSKGERWVVLDNELIKEPKE